jgi:carbon storage regulator
MLVLSRKPSQQVLIGPDITVTIVRIDRNRVRIGISAPPEVPILREELAAKPLGTKDAAPVEPVRARSEAQAV